MECGKAIFIYGSVKNGTEYIPQNVGLRDISISDEGELLINGMAVKLKGINHHDMTQNNEHYLSREDIQKDLLLIKKLNINTIRTSHYPPEPYFLELSDRMGFYVIEESDIEAHG